MKFSYTTEMTHYGMFRMPVVSVEFSNPADDTKKQEMFSLIDSGAACISLNAQYAERLGIRLESRRRVEFQGISNPPVVGYEHLLKIRLKNDTHSFSVPCYFIPDLQTSALLGQRGFFENYKITFELYKKRFELTPFENK